jgi:protein-ribulosamine 3-kinase
MINWTEIEKTISAATRSHFSISRTSPVSGGDINQAWHIEGNAGQQRNPLYYFVKLNSADKSGLFSAEIAGLTALASSGTIRVPKVITGGTAGQYAFLVLEYLALQPHGNDMALGEQLAALHRVQAPRFGWEQDNSIGITPQINRWAVDWITFWGECRLGYQLELAASNCYGGQLQRAGNNLVAALPELFAGHAPSPSLLHGDLWGGNCAFLADGSPVIFDPASYYGDREADIAMTELFGGYSPEFYAAYQAAYPLNDGYQVRKTLYNLYHILNHANMFGGSYVQQAERMMQNLLAGVK